MLVKNNKFKNIMFSGKIEESLQYRETSSI